MQLVTRLMCETVLRLFACAAAVLLSACAGPAAGVPPAPSQAANDSYSYIIGAGDTLNIIFARNP
jgi:polysaccharide biosynthesis/export protein